MLTYAKDSFLPKRYDYHAQNQHGYLSDCPYEDGEDCSMAGYGNSGLQGERQGWQCHARVPRQCGGWGYEWLQASSGRRAHILQGLLTLATASSSKDRSRHVRKRQPSARTLDTGGARPPTTMRTIGLVLLTVLVMGKDGSTGTTISVGMIAAPYKREEWGLPCRVATYAG